jgi:hypothetical protein
MNDLKDRLIRLGSKQPELQKHIRPVLDRISIGEDPHVFNREEYFNKRNAIKAAVGDWLDQYTMMSQIGESDLKKIRDYVAQNVRKPVGSDDPGPAGPSLEKENEAPRLKTIRSIVHHDFRYDIIS